jgi:Domain of unknown function (DUF4276)
MSQVTLALYAEGSSDGNFLPHIIKRTTETILAQHGRPDIAVPLPDYQWQKPANIAKRVECILHIARQTTGYHILIIHSDGDDRGYGQTVAELFQPGKNRVLSVSLYENVCKHLVPLIPIRMTEAWMLADPDTLCRVLGKKAEARTLGIPIKAKLVEKELNPKTSLDHVIKSLYPRASKKQQQEHKNRLYKDLGPKISLKRLSEVPSYQQFVEDLTSTLLQTLDFMPK